MDTDFVNTYIQKQSQLITELTQKNLMVETKLQLLEAKYAELAERFNALVTSVEKAREESTQARNNTQPSEDFADEETTESQP